MATEILQVAVLGAGVMGSQLAAHMASAGVDVLLLDRVAPGTKDRNSLAKEAVARMLAEGGVFTHPDAARRITVGNFEDDLRRIESYTWILETVIEDLAVKKGLFEKIDALRRPGAVISSNTSTIPLTKLIEGRSEAFVKDFMITHFFNPVRFMRLLELIAGAETSPEVSALIADFCDRRLGKGVVFCNDVPGFIANRLGLFWMQSAANAAMDLGLTVEETDTICHLALGTPRTGVFGLMDLMGLDLMPLVGQNLMALLEPGDMYRNIYQQPELFKKMIAGGFTGRKGKGGFYRYLKTEEGTAKEVINLETGSYASYRVPALATIELAAGELRTLCEANDKIGQFAWRVLSETLSYAFQLVPSAAGNIAQVDEGMRLGYGWKWGPFEMIDKLGPAWFEQKLRAELRSVPALLESVGPTGFYCTDAARRHAVGAEGSYVSLCRAPDVLLLSDIKLTARPIERNEAAELWDLGDGVLCLSLTTPDNVVNAGVWNMVEAALALISDGRGSWKGLVFYNEGGMFSSGNDVREIEELIGSGAQQALEEHFKKAQDIAARLRFALFPSVAALAGPTFDAGCELALHCSALQAHTDLSMGLMEAKRGRVPAYGGLAPLLVRIFEAKKKCPCNLFVGPCRCNDTSPVTRLFELVAGAKVSSSAAEAKEWGFLKASDGISINIDRLLADAKAKLLELAAGYRPLPVRAIQMPGPLARVELEAYLDRLSPPSHQARASRMLVEVLCGAQGDLSGRVSEKQIADAMRGLFIKLLA